MSALMLQASPAKSKEEKTSGHKTILTITKSWNCLASNCILHVCVWLLLPWCKTGGKSYDKVVLVVLMLLSFSSA